MKNKYSQKNCNNDQTIHKRGPSSFWMHDPGAVFNSLALSPGDYILDLGCGPGNYSIEASRIVGDSGMVYAFDKDNYMIRELETIAREKGIPNLNTILADITKPLPVMDNSIDLCLIATVLHIPAVSKKISVILNEVCRVLKPGKRLAIIECKKEDMPFGPPIDMRLAPDDIEKTAKSHGLNKLGLVDLGYNYLIQFNHTDEE